MKTGHWALEQWTIYKHSALKNGHGHRSVLISWVGAACSGTCIRKQSVPQTNYFSSLLDFGTLEEAIWCKGETLWVWQFSSAVSCLTLGKSLHLLPGPCFSFCKVGWGRGWPHTLLLPDPASKIDYQSSLLADGLSPAQCSTCLSPMKSGTEVCCCWWCWYLCYIPNT